MTTKLLNHQYVLAFVFACAVSVLPLHVFAYTEIKNSVSSYVHTGGQSSVDGEDGQDGADGEDGKSGTNGKSVITGNSSASIHIETTIDGQKVFEVYKTATSTGGEAIHLEANNGTGNVSVQAQGTTSVNEVNTLEALFASIRQILVLYVSELL